MPTPKESPNLVRRNQNSAAQFATLLTPSLTLTAVISCFWILEDTTQNIFILPVIIYGPEYCSFQVRFPCFSWLRQHLFVSSRVSFNFQGRRVRPALGRSYLATGARSVLRKGGR
jgi:hypothetical protein